MRAAIFEKPGLENLKIQHNVEQPKITDHDVLIRVKMAGVNPFDHITISGTRPLPVQPLPHIPGVETSGEIEKVGKHVSTLKGG
jgi:NADPH:quinone reductase-like Zn-dependent oxidoreductase